MNRKGLSLLLILGMVFVFAGVSTANVPAPPVNQTIGFPDVEGLAGLTEEDCEACHTGNPDRHHMLYGSTIPDPSLVPNPDANGDGTLDTNYGCLNCHDEDDSTGIIVFLVERNCIVCHSGDSPHHGGTIPEIVAGDCVSCHGDLVDNWDDGHRIPTYAPSLVTPSPKASVCAVTGDPCGNDSYCTTDVCAAKGTLCSVDTDCDQDVCEDSKADCVDNYDCAPGHCSTDGSVCNTDADCPGGGCRGEEACIIGPDTCSIGGELCVGSATPQPGGCNYCHDAGTDIDSGLEIVDNHDTHHGAMPAFVQPGETRNCYSCHTHDGYDANDMRKCEECHGLDSLHQIQADSDNDGDITVNGELAGYGHVGIDDPANGESDCWGCHSTTGQPLAPYPLSGVVTPTLADASVTTITAGAATAITLTGNAFTNDALTSVVEVTGASGSIDVVPSAISVGSLTATIPALDAGSYQIRVKKEGVVSNPTIISCVPAVTIASDDCAEGVLTITGSGFGDAPPAGAEEFINVKLGADTAEIIRWSDTEIQVSGCDGDDAVTVNALYGSAATGATACAGNFDGDQNVDGSDLGVFKPDFGRSPFNVPCAAGNPCDGDFDCDGDVDGSDASGIKADFGRSAHQNPCAEQIAAGCGY